MTLEDNLGSEWYVKLKREFNEPYMKKLGNFIARRRTTTLIHPEDSNIFRAFRLTPYNRVKVVILGQDPYYNGISNGLAFGCNNGIIQPKAQRIIFEEIEEDEKFGLFLEGDVSLEKWALQGVLLLNTLLTVEDCKSNSHKGIGWERFTSIVINKLNAHPNRLVFMLWGNTAKKYAPHINQKIHKLLIAGHPITELYSRFSDGDKKGSFFGCKHFSQANKFLKENNIKTINW